MKNTKQYEQSLKELFTMVEYYNNNYCGDEPKNKIIRCRNSKVMKLIQKEIKDLGEE